MFETHQQFIYKVIDLKKQGLRNADIAKKLQVPTGRVHAIVNALAKHHILTNVRTKYIQQELRAYISSHARKLREYAKS